MSALTDIDNLRLNWRDEDGSAQFASPLRTAAALYIVELEADLDILDGKYVAALAELAALKGRRCETCKNFGKMTDDAATRLPYPVVCFRGVTPNGRMWPPGFACNRWAELDRQKRREKP
jgi:hypothetical protein